MALRELLDKNELQRLQDGFCRLSGLSAYCLDHEGTKITRISGDDRYLHCLQERLALERVFGNDSLEDMAVEPLEGKKEVAALAIAARGEKELYWIVFRSELVKEDAFYQGLDLLRDASITFLQGKLQSYGAQANTIRNEADSKKMSQGMKTLQAMGRLVRLLESADDVGSIMRDWLEIVSTHLEVDLSQIFKLQIDEKYMDVICEWKKSGENSFFDHTSHVPTYSFLKNRRKLIVNADTVTDPEFREIYQLGVKAMMIFPVGTKEGGMAVAFSNRKSYVFDEEKEQFAAEAVTILDSILIRRIQQNSLEITRTAVETVLDGIGACILIWDEARHRAVYANRLFQNTFGVDVEEERFEWLFEGAQPKEEGMFSETKEVFHEEKGRFYDLTVTEVRWTDGNVYRAYSFHDVTERKNYQGQIERQEFVDVLTGLYNRLRCERDLAALIETAIQQNKQGAVMHLNLDDFRRFNEGLGHQYGDALLKAIAHALQKIPGIKDACYRVGGDEFVILVSPVQYGELDLIIEDVQDVFGRPWYLKDDDYYCTMSMGVVSFPEYGDSVNELLKKADEAMLTAKKTGKDCYHFYREETPADPPQTSDKIISIHRKR